jgi:hypothetical protein
MAKELVLTDSARVLGGDPLAGFNSVEGRLQVSKLVVCVVRKAWTAPRNVAGIRGWKSSTFGDEVSGVDPKSELTLNGFRDSGDGKEGGIPATPKDSKHGGRVDSGVLR